jgi:hypothetical protein
MPIPGSCSDEAATYHIRYVVPLKRTHGLVTPLASHAGLAPAGSTGAAEFVHVIVPASKVARPIAMVDEPQPVYHIRSLAPLARRQGVPTPALSQAPDVPPERTGAVPDFVHARPSDEVARPIARM